jgi:hypothetical protein
MKGAARRQEATDDGKDRFERFVNGIDLDTEVLKGRGPEKQ